MRKKFGSSKSTRGTLDLWQDDHDRWEELKNSKNKGGDNKENEGDDQILAENNEINEEGMLEPLFELDELYKLYKTNAQQFVNCLREKNNKDAIEFANYCVKKYGNRINDFGSNELIPLMSYELCLTDITEKDLKPLEILAEDYPEGISFFCCAGVALKIKALASENKEAEEIIKKIKISPTAKEIQITKKFIERVIEKVIEKEVAVEAITG